MSIKNALQDLLNNLDTIAADHQEIFDTAVREAMYLAIRASFIVPEPDYQLPQTFAMFTDEGNRQVRHALAQFLSHSDVQGAAVQLKTPEERLAAFQDDDAQSADGSTYEDYFGYADKP